MSNFMSHTNYKQMIEEYKKLVDDEITIENGGFVNEYDAERYANTGYDMQVIEGWWIDKLKSQAIKSLNNEMEYLESKKKEINCDNTHRMAIEGGLKICHTCSSQAGYNLAVDNHISHLLLEKSRINEEE